MLASARAVGEYTETHILPKLTAASPKNLLIRNECSTTHRGRLRRRPARQRSTRFDFQPSIQPILDDRPTPFEIELITRFRDDRS